MRPVPDDAGSKRERIELSFSQVPDADLSQVTRRILEQSHVHVSPSRRYQLEDLLCAEDAPPEIPKKARRELARALDLSELTQHHDRFLRLLDRFWISEDGDLSFEEVEDLLLNGMRPVTLRDPIKEISNETEARGNLYQRLLNSSPDNSEGQKNLFIAYHQILGPSPGDPALLPEVWLHWDHRTVQERGPEALLRSRIDFLLLLPHGQRVVLEVDGSQHYDIVSFGVIVR
ncbi:hypothetical protein [Streptomyces sp. NPDC054783]